VILGAREWKYGVACGLAKGIFFRCVFALSDVGIEGAGGGDFIGERYARVWSGGDGAGATWKQVRQREGGLGVAGDDGGGGCAAKGAWGGGALQKGVWGGGSAHGGGARMQGGTSEGWGQ
jgi:hypothetical protein